MLGIGEVLLIVLAVFLIFGASRLPKLGKSLGEGIKEFKQALKSGLATDVKGEGEETKGPPEI